MRYYILPLDLDNQTAAALTRGLGISPVDTQSVAKLCARYGLTDVAAVADYLDDAWAALSTAGLLGVPIMCDHEGRLCYDVPDVSLLPWQDDEWLRSLVGQVRKIKI